MTVLRPFPVRYLLLIALPAALFGCVEPPPLPLLGDPAPLVAPAGTHSHGPRLSTINGANLLSWMEKTDSGAELRFAELDGLRWGAPQTVIADPQMFVNWADLPSVNRLADGRLVAHWLRYSAEGTYTYDIKVATGVGVPAKFGAAVSPHDDGTLTEHGFVTVYPAGTGAGLLWLDGRNTLEPAADDAPPVAMTLRAATLDPAGNIVAGQLVDDRVCDCCQTDVDVSASGPLAVYRDRTQDEIRDIYLSRWRDGAWQPGERFSFDDWEIAACPVNGPAIDAASALVAVTWFSAAGGRPRLQSRVSRDGGESFGKPVVMADRRVLGHADVAVIDEHTVAVSWLESGKGELKDIRLRLVSRQGQAGPVMTVGRTALSRVVPQLAYDNKRLLVVWTDSTASGQQLRGVAVPLTFAEFE